MKRKQIQTISSNLEKLMSMTNSGWDRTDFNHKLI